MGRRPRRCACASVIGMQTRPRPCLARKLIFSAVTNSAAKTRSPSFSRSSSSTRMTMLPARIAEMISAIGLMAAVSLRIARFYACFTSLPLFRAFGFLSAGAFADARRLAGTRAQVVKLCPAHVALALDLDRGDQGRVGLEGALHALARGDLAHDEGGVEAAVALGDDHAFEGLDALAFAFDHVHVHHHGVARREIRDVARQALDFFLLECLD